MRSVHFGAGNIGRGFIGLLLYESGFQTTFVDVNDTVIQALNDEGQYNVSFSAEKSTTTTVYDVSGINSVKDPEAVIGALVDADVVTTAVGPAVLPIIAELIAAGLKERMQAAEKSPVNVIACENMVGGSTALRDSVYSHATAAEQTAFDEWVGFPDAAVDRIVPNQSQGGLLDVAVEPYHEWIVEDSHIKGESPAIDGVTYVPDLLPYIERKLFTVNTGHLVPAYVGHYLGYDTIYEAIQDDAILNLIKGVLHESGEALVQTYHFDREAHADYINTIIGRFKNPYISDEVTRVGRNPIRKLGENDRLIRPAMLYWEHTGNVPASLARTIAAALVYQNEADDEARELQKTIREQGYAKTLQTISGLEAEHPITQAVIRELESLDDLKARRL